MGCNKDSNCLNIARKIYPELQSEVDSLANNMNNQITETIEGLSGLNVPNDYLGIKVRGKLSEIIAGFSSDISNLESKKGNIDSFISQKENEHENHYKTWKAQQDLLNKKKTEEDEKDE